MKILEEDGHCSAANDDYMDVRDDEVVSIQAACVSSSGLS